MKEYKFDSTRIVVEGDLVYSVTAGVTTLETAKSVLEVCAQVLVKHKRLYMLTDLSNGFNVSADVRRYQAEWGSQHQITASALFGAGAVTRAMVTLIHGAMSLVGKTNFSLRFFATEPEARAWINELRAKLPPVSAASTK
jgi:hypothetical protein